MPASLETGIDNYRLWFEVLGYIGFKASLLFR